MDQYFFLLIFYLGTDGWMEFGGSVREGSFEECFVVGSSVEEYSVWGILSLMVLVVVVWSVEGGSVEEYSVGIFCEGKFCRGIFCEGYSVRGSSVGGFSFEGYFV